MAVRLTTGIDLHQTPCLSARGEEGQTRTRLYRFFVLTRYKNQMESKHRLCTLEMASQGLGLAPHSQPPFCRLSHFPSWSPSHTLPEVIRAARPITQLTRLSPPCFTPLLYCPRHPHRSSDEFRFIPSTGRVLCNADEKEGGF